MRIPAALSPVLLLIASNVFMTFAWYGHLKFKDRPVWVVILVSWFIALAEYCLAVPANRYGSSVYSVAELKVMQEVITLSRVRRVFNRISGRAADSESPDRFRVLRTWRFLRVQGPDPLTAKIGSD